MEADFQQWMASASSMQRRAALLLHGLPTDDQEWVLQRLPEGGRHSLSGLLVELQTLGIPHDPELVESVLGSKSESVALLEEPRSEGAEQAAADVLRSLSLVEMQALSACLKREPHGVTARLLSLERWPWSAQFEAAGMGQAIEAANAQLPSNGETGTCLRAALSEAVLKRVRAGAMAVESRERVTQAEAPAPASNGPRSAWSKSARRLVGRLTRWGVKA